MIKMTWPQYKRNECTVNGRVVKLGPKMADVLLVMMLRAPYFVPTQDIVEFVYTPDEHPEMCFRNIQIIIKRLRARVGNEIVQSKSYTGYRLVTAGERV